MRRTLSRGLFILVMAAPIGTFPANAQYHFYNELSGSTGDPCLYGQYTSQRGEAQCWAVGSCYNQLYYPDVSWDQSWSCADGNYVTVGGSSDRDYAYGYDDQDNYVSYLFGLFAYGSAKPYPPGSHTYVGWDEADCNGDTDYSGPYNYTC